MYTILNFTVLIVKQSYKVMNVTVLFPNGSCIEENHRTSLHRFDAKVLYILCITTKCVKSQQNYLFKKSAKYTRPKKVFRKEFLHKIALI